MKILKGKLVVYDSDCPLCRGLRRQALFLGILAEEDCLSLYDLSPQYSAAVDSERFRNEMALVDTGGGQTLYGTDGLLAVFSMRYPQFEPLLAVPSFRALCRGLYKVVAPNRYVLSTPQKSAIGCTCSDVGSRNDRLRYIGVGLLLSVVITLLFVFSLRSVLFEGSYIAPVAAIAMGWVVYFLIAAVVLRKIFIEFAAQMVSVMWRGTALLLPAIFTAAVTSSPAILLPLTGGCIAVSFGYMLHQHELRMRAMELQPLWTALWAGLLWSSTFAVLVWRMP